MSTFAGCCKLYNSMHSLFINFSNNSHLLKRSFSFKSVYSFQSSCKDATFNDTIRKMNASNIWNRIILKKYFSTDNATSFVPHNIERSISAKLSTILKTKESKYPPILENKNKIFVGAKNLDYDKNHLKKLFSKFGSIHSVLVPKIKVYDENPNDNTTFRYAFIFYNNEYSAINAVQAGFILDETRNIQIEIKDTNLDPEMLRSVVIHDLPDYVKVKDIFNHFKDFGEVELVNFVYNATLNVSGLIKNFALIVFKNKQDALKVIETVHIIDSVRYLVTPASKEGKQRKERCRKVLVKDIPLSECDVSILTEHFSKVAPLQKVFVLRDSSTNMPNGTALVEFLTQDGAQKAEDDIHEIAGVKVLVKALGWSNMKLDRTFYPTEKNN